MRLDKLEVQLDKLEVRLDKLAPEPIQELPGRRLVPVLQAQPAQQALQALLVTPAQTAVPQEPKLVLRLVPLRTKEQTLTAARVPPPKFQQTVPQEAKLALPPVPMEMLGPVALVEPGILGYVHPSSIVLPNRSF